VGEGEREREKGGEERAGDRDVSGSDFGVPAPR